MWLAISLPSMGKEPEPKAGGEPDLTTQVQEDKSETATLKDEYDRLSSEWGRTEDKRKVFRKAVKTGLRNDSVKTARIQELEKVLAEFRLKASDPNLPLLSADTDIFHIDVPDETSIHPALRYYAKKVSCISAAAKKLTELEHEIDNSLTNFKNGGMEDSRAKEQIAETAKISDCVTELNPIIAEIRRFELDAFTETQKEYINDILNRYTLIINEYFM